MSNVKNSKKTNFSSSNKGLTSQGTLQFLVDANTTVDRADWITLGANPGSFEGSPRFYDVNTDGVATLTDVDGNIVSRNVVSGMRVLLADCETVTTDGTCQLIAMW